MTIYCDSKSALNQFLRPNYGSIKDYLVADYDLLNEGRSLYKQLKDFTDISLTWVKGHHSGKKMIQHKLNEDAHHLAYNFIAKDQGYYNPSTTSIDPPSAEISILFNGSTLTSKISSFLRDQLTSGPLQSMICKAENWTSNEFLKVDWESYKKALQQSSRSHRMNLVKLSHNLGNTNSQNKKYYGKSDICPCCNLVSETSNHVFACNSESASSFRAEQLDVLIGDLKAAGTPDDLSEAILHGIKSWCQIQQGLQLTQRSPTYGSLNPISVAVTQAYSEQTRLLGWDNFLRGRISKLWSIAYSKCKPSPMQSLSQWTAKLISYTLKFSYSLWAFRNGIVHGHSLEEQEAKEREALCQEVRRAYEEYQRDKFIVPSNFCYLFLS